MRKSTLTRNAILILLFISILACDISYNAPQNDQLNKKELELKLTEVAMQTTQTAMVAPDSSEEEQSDASPADSEEEANNDSEDEDECNSSRMVSESIPDGTNFQAGETFTKSWTLRNAGDCDWTTEYKFVYEAGDQMGGKSSMNVPSVIEPGETVTFNIDMTAPTTDGSYTGVWRLKADDGEKLGKYWANISVGHTSAGAGGAQLPDDNQPGGDTTGTFKITYLLIDYFSHTYDLFCPDTVSADIRFDGVGSGTIEYRVDTRFESTNHSFYFDNEAIHGPIGKGHSFNVPESGVYPITITVTKPNPMSTSRTTTITCVK